MSDKLPLSTHILDTTIGKPGANVRVKLFKCIENFWANSTPEFFTTDSNGRFNGFVKIDNEIRGIYKLKFEVGEYFKSQGKDTLYPYVEITFKIDSDQEHYHIPLIVTPFSYSTYRGS